VEGSDGASEEAASKVKLEQAEHPIAGPKRVVLRRSLSALALVRVFVTGRQTDLALTMHP
jgi:hypothetical protein